MFSPLDDVPPTDIDQATFLQQMPIPTASMGGDSYGIPQVMAVDETSGSLNAVSIWWNRSDTTVYIHDLAVAVIQ
jgi:hypothetical protein